MKLTIIIDTSAERFYPSASAAIAKVLIELAAKFSIDMNEDIDRLADQGHAGALYSTMKDICGNTDSHWEFTTD